VLRTGWGKQQGVVMSSAIEKLRELDAQIVQHVIDRGKLWEKRKALVAKLQGSDDIKTYHAELTEWFNEIGIKEKQS